MSTASIAPRSESRSALLRAAQQYASGSVLSMAGSVLRVGVAARLLAPDVNGLWLGLQLLFSYSSHLHFGVLFGTFRNVSILRGRGDSAGADAVKRTSFTFICAIALLSIVGWTTVSMLLPSWAGRRRYLLATGALSVMTLFRSYLTIVFKSESRFGELSAATAIGSLVSIATVGLIWRWGLDGLIWGMFAQGIVEGGILAFRERWTGLQLELALLRDAATVGVVTMLIVFATTFLTTIDRTVMLQKLGALATGYYYLGANIVAMLPALALLPTAVLTPKFFERYGQTGDAAGLFGLVRTPIQVGSVLLAATLGVGALALPCVVALLWPRLVAGNVAADCALLATFPIVLAGVVSNVFYAVNRQFIQLAIICASAVAGYVAAICAVHITPSIAAASVGSLVGLWSYYVGSAVVACRLMAATKRSTFALIGGSIAPVAVIGGLVLIIERLGRHFATDKSIVRMVVEEGVMLMLVGPWAIRAWKKLKNG